MKIHEAMSKNPQVCMPSTSLTEAAKMMVECDCGSLPVVENCETARPLVGVITDRDIVCRSLGAGRSPMEMTVQDCMSTASITARPEQNVEEGRDLMERNQIRRLPVVDDSGAVVGVLTQAHIGRLLPREEAGEYLREVSQKPDHPRSRVAAGVR